MTNARVLAALWVGLALLATLLGRRRSVAP
jgi:hypothetical protein